MVMIQIMRLVTEPFIDEFTNKKIKKLEYRIKEKEEKSNEKVK